MNETTVQQNLANIVELVAQLKAETKAPRGQWSRERIASNLAYIDLNAVHASRKLDALTVKVGDPVQQASNFARVTNMDGRVTVEPVENDEGYDAVRGAAEYREIPHSAFRNTPS